MDHGVDICLRPCLHGVGDLGLVEYVSFVLCPPERENKRNQPTRPGSLTPCKQGLSYNTTHSKKKIYQLNKIQENKEGEPRNKRSQYNVSCFIVLIVLKLKQTNDSRLRLLSSFPVKS